MKTRPLSAAVSAMLAGGLMAAVGLPATPAVAIPVFDASNYTQNILTAARTLQQVNNQIRSLQNEATMLINQAKNLSRIDFPQMQAITQTLQQIDQLMGQAQAIRFQVSGLDQQFSRLFPSDFGQALRTNQLVTAARARLDASMPGSPTRSTYTAGSSCRAWHCRRCSGPVPSFASAALKATSSAPYANPPNRADRGQAISSSRRISASSRRSACARAGR